MPFFIHLPPPLRDSVRDKGAKPITKVDPELDAWLKHVKDMRAVDVKYIFISIFSGFILFGIFYLIISI